MPGMSDGQCRVWEVQDVTGAEIVTRYMLGVISIEGGMVDWCTPLAMGEPCLDDPATLGCLEHGLLPDAWPGHVISQVDGDLPDGTSVHVTSIHHAGSGRMVFGSEGKPKGERLVLALEAAP